MSDIDEGDREGDKAYSGRVLGELTESAREILNGQLGFTMEGAALRTLCNGVDVLHALVLSQQATIDDLRETLETYMRRSAPALSAARMHVPIGGGDSFWRRQQEKRQAERQAEAKRRLEELKPQVIAELTELFDLDAIDRLVEMPDGTMRETPPKKVQRKRSRKISRRK